MRKQFEGAFFVRGEGGAGGEAGGEGGGVSVEGGLGGGGVVAGGAAAGGAVGTGIEFNHLDGWKSFSLEKIN